MIKYRILILSLTLLFLHEMASGQDLAFSAGFDNASTTNQYRYLYGCALPGVHKKDHCTGYNITRVIMVTDVAAFFACGIVALFTNSASFSGTTTLSPQNSAILVDAEVSVIGTFFVSWYLNRRFEKHEFRHPERFSVVGNKNQLGIAYNF